MNEQFKELASICRAGVSISVNPHKSVFESVDEYMSEEVREYVQDGAFDQMVLLDTIVEIQAYPLSSVGFILVHHHDIDAAISIALEASKEKILRNR